jgi:2-succinyl-5-enolpyruvyl-6-hydroxy-3-cyclohexene-1-carboxylate synthase
MANSTTPARNPPSPSSKNKNDTCVTCIDSAWQSAKNAVRQCLTAGVTEFVVCGGARNAVILEHLARLAARDRIRVWSHFEERSAGFFALGRTMETGLPCAVVTTSGTAVAELLPAVIEASYQARPLVPLTADRPAAARHSGAPQTIVQPGIFGPHAHTDPATWNGRGPLHLNVELPEEIDIPAADDDALPAPAAFEPAWEKPNVAELARWLRNPGLRGMVVIIGGLEPTEREEVWHFCRALDVPVIAEATSGLREALAVLQMPDGDRLLRQQPPSKILRLGDCPSGRFWRDLENLTDVEVFSITRNGLPGIAREDIKVITGSVDRVLRALGEVEALGDMADHLVHRGRDAARIDELLEAHPDSEPALVRAISNYAALSESVFLGNSLPIREWNLFAQWDRPCTAVRANRGANGIDGQLSTWLGATAEVSGAWAVVGDLTALYDPAAAALLGQLETRGRVLAVINNQGGRIFERLPRLDSMSPRARDWLVHPQEADFSAFAALWQMRHHRIATPDDLDAFDPEAAGESATLLEITPSAKETAAFWRAWSAAT